MISVRNWRDRIDADPLVMHGRACIRGTRIPVSVVLDNLAAGRSQTEILEAYPTLQEADVLAALGYAAELARDEVHPLQPGAS
jgi:uncharacterized protein (DUF433 family)